MSCYIINMLFKDNTKLYYLWLYCRLAIYYCLSISCMIVIRAVCLSVCLFVSLSVCQFVCLSVCLFVILSICLFFAWLICLCVLCMFVFFSVSLYFLICLNLKDIIIFISPTPYRSPVTPYSRYIVTKECLTMHNVDLSYNI